MNPLDTMTRQLTGLLQDDSVVQILVQDENIISDDLLVRVAHIAGGELIRRSKARAQVDTIDDACLIE